MIQKIYVKFAIHYNILVARDEIKTLKKFYKDLSSKFTRLFLILLLGRSKD